MTSQADFVVTRHLQSTQKRVGFCLVFTVIQWLISLPFHAPAYNASGLVIMSLLGGALLRFPMRVKVERQQFFLWGALPLLYGFSLHLIHRGDSLDLRGLLMMSFSLFIIVLMPRGRYRYVSTPLFLVAFIGSGYINHQPLWNYERLFYMVLIDSALATFIGQIAARYEEKTNVEIHRGDTFMRNLLGNSIQKYISQGSESQLEGKSRTGFLMQFDIRGFSGLVRSFEEDVVATVLSEYYNIVSLAVGRHGGVVHRTAGDSHIVCFGIYNNEDKDRKELFKSALQCFSDITRELLALQTRNKLSEAVTIGGALDYGELKVHIFGHLDYHREVDLLGPVLIRCARLESFTKVILARQLHPTSMLILSQDALRFSEKVDAFEVFQVGDEPVRDFSHIRWLAYQSFS